MGAVCLAAGTLLLVLPLRAQSSSPVFVDGDRCTLRGPLPVQLDGASASRLIPSGAVLEVTSGGRRFSEVRPGASASDGGPPAASARGLVENTALAKVCVVERARCLVRVPLDVTGTGDPRHEGKRLRVQKGGTLVVLERDRQRSRALVRVGQLDARVPLAALVAACPSLARTFAEQDAKQAEEASTSTEREGPTSAPAPRPGEPR